jgi:hypothetical protein
VLIDAAHDAALSGRELAVATQYKAHDTNAYALGHLEHREEFAQHAKEFAWSFTAIQTALSAGLLDEDTVERLDTVRRVREAYTAANERLFDAADAQRTAPSPANQAALDAAWEAQDTLGDELDTVITDLPTTSSWTRNGLRPRPKRAGSLCCGCSAAWARSSGGLSSISLSHPSEQSE